MFRGGIGDGSGSHCAMTVRKRRREGMERCRRKESGLIGEEDHDV